MEKIGIEISVPIGFTEDDALDVLYKTFRRLTNVRAIASKPIIHPVGIDGHRFSVEFEVWKIGRRIRMHGTINLVNRKYCDYYGDIINMVSEELYCQLQNFIKTAQKSQTPSVADTWA